MKRRPTAGDDARDLVRSLGIERATQLAGSLSRASTQLQVRVSPARIASYRAAAKRDGKTLSAWVLSRLDSAL